MQAKSRRLVGSASVPHGTLARRDDGGSWLGVTSWSWLGSSRRWPSSRPGGRRDSAAFAKDHRERVVISDQGTVRLGQALVPTGPTRRRAGLGPRPEPGRERLRGHRRRGQGLPPRQGRRPAWTVASTRPTPRPFAWPPRPTARSSSAPGPSGQVVEVTDPSIPRSRPDPEVQYIWDLAADPKGNLYAATGPTGQLWKRSRDGKWSLLLDSKAAHLLCVAVGPDGAVYAGSDGEGLIYRVGRDGKVSVVYDAPQAEVRTLLVAPDGVALRRHGRRGRRRVGSEPAAGAVLGTRRTSRDAPGGRMPGRRIGPGDAPAATISRPGRASRRRRPKAAPRPPVGGSAAPKAGHAGRQRGLPDRARRRRPRGLPGQGPDLRPRLVGRPPARRHRARGPALRGPRPGPRARRWRGSTTARSSRCWPSRGGEILLGTGDPGAVVRLSSGFVPEGELVSEVHDTKLISRFGALSLAGRAARRHIGGASRSGRGNVRRARRDLVGLVGRADRPELGLGPSRRPAGSSSTG